MLPSFLNQVRLNSLLATTLLIPVTTFAAGLAFSPSSLNFGANAIGESKKLTVKLKNNTAQDIGLGTASLGNNPGRYYSITGTTCTDILVAGQTCTYGVLFVSRQLKPAQARLELSTQDPGFPLIKLPLLGNRYPALNDTGITQCANWYTDGLLCPQPEFPGQDAQYGRDKSRGNNSNGHAGLNYTKLNANGKTLPATATYWDCVRDNVTGLVWEKKPLGDGITGNQGLNDADDSYTWYSTDAGNNGGSPGHPNKSNACFGYVSAMPATWCNTEAYVNRVNAAGWCGAKNWRMPTRKELLNIVDYSIPSPGPTIDVDYFPDTQRDWYWSSSPWSGNDKYGLLVWYVDFFNGYDQLDQTDNIDGRYYDGVRVRLVRVAQ